MTIHDSTERGPVLFNCALCGGQTPQGQRHTCPLPTGKQQRRLEAQQRLEAIRAAREQQLLECRDCGASTKPGEWHLCTGSRDNAHEIGVEAHVRGLAGALKRFGYKLEKDG